MLRIRVSEPSLRRLGDTGRATSAKMQPVGDLLQSQVKERFATRGTSGGMQWPPSRSAYSTFAHLADTFQVVASQRAAQTYSDFPFIHVHQLGTVGKGGVLPTIRPLTKKALYIPITPQARSGWNPALIAGKWKDGQLDPPDADYYFSAFVNIPPRPMLPDSGVEREQQGHALALSLLK